MSSHERAGAEGIAPGFDGQQFGFDEAYLHHRDSALWHRRREDIVRRGASEGRLLDVGCNYGFFLRACEGRFECHGVDASRHALYHARRLAPKAHLVGCDVRDGLPYQDGAFDVVTMFDVLEHVSDYESLLREAARVLVPGGMLVLTTPNRWSMNSLFFGKDYWLRRDPTHQVVLARRTLLHALLNNGFVRCRCRTVGLLHFLGDFGRNGRLAHPGKNLGPAPEPHRGRLRRLPPPLKRLLIGAWQSARAWFDDLPTPWGANLYVFSWKTSQDWRRIETKSRAIPLQEDVET